MRHGFSLIPFLVFGCLANGQGAFAQATPLNGRVVDETGAPIAGAVVELLAANQNTRTDAAGRYAFGAPSSLPSPGAVRFQPRLDGSILRFDLAEPSAVAVEAWQASGARSRVLLDTRLAAGSHGLDLGLRGLKELRPGFQWIRIRIGSRETWFRTLVDGEGRAFAGRMEAGSRPAPKRTAAAAPADTLRFSKDGFQNEILAVAQSSGPVSDVTLRKGLGFVPHFIGSGDIEDIATGRRLALPMDRRIHVILFAEGYTEADYRAGRFDAAVASWYSSVFAVNPLDVFKQAFVIWKFPAVSATNVSTAGSAPTFFKIPVTSSGVGSTSALAPAIWDALGKFPYAPKAFFPSGGGTSNAAKGVVGQFLILDPRSGRAGFSGHARSFANPANSRQNVKVCFGQTQQHEFFHSFSMVSDEYYDEGHGAASVSPQDRSSALDNISGIQTCTGLPWKHLLPGGSINPSTQNLIGAFGSRGRYHSEFKCLMNGSHDNAALFGGNGNLRLGNRLCNWDREIALFRLYERTSVLADNAASWTAWTGTYRTAFYRKFPFYAPAVLPQQTSAGNGVFLACTQGAEPLGPLARTGIATVEDGENCDSR